MWEAFLSFVVNVVAELTFARLTGSDAATKKVKETEAKKVKETEAKKVKETEAQAKAAETWLAQARQAQAKKTPSASTLPDSELPEEDEAQAKIDSLPNAQRPAGERVIRVWDIYASLWRDVRIREFTWHNVGQAGCFGQSNARKDIVVDIRDQVAEAWVIEFVTGRKVDIPQR